MGIGCSRYSTPNPTEDRRRKRRRKQAPNTEASPKLEKNRHGNDDDNDAGKR